MRIRAKYVDGVFKPLEEVTDAVPGKVYRVFYEQEPGGLVEKKRILIVDDEVSVTRTLKLHLERTGAYEVRTENQGSRGLEAAREFGPDLILLDIIMPDLEGGAVAAKIKADATLKDIPIVFLSGVVSEKAAGAHGREIAGHTFLAKPFDPQQVIDCIEKHLKRFL